jgi:hypothetical protein
MREHLRLAAEFEDRVEGHEQLTPVGPGHFSLVCLRHVGGADRTRGVADAINATGSLVVTVAEDLDSDPYVRVSIGQSTTTAADVDRLWAVIDRTAAE